MTRDSFFVCETALSNRVGRGGRKKPEQGHEFLVLVHSCISAPIILLPIILQQ